MVLAIGLLNMLSEQITVEFYFTLSCSVTRRSIAHNVVFRYERGIGENDKKLVVIQLSLSSSAMNMQKGESHLK